MKIEIHNTYTTSTIDTFNIPVIETVDDIDYWYIKWNELHYKLVGDDTIYTISPEGYYDEGIIDMKRPDTSYIYSVDGVVLE